ncbi:hypothetical protein TNCV_1146661 [Trichonephila clavipes]|nr:hypothetical protein TNCV_1146661 [Trichonephila clavipes]
MSMTWCDNGSKFSKKYRRRPSGCFITLRHVVWQLASRTDLDSPRILTSPIPKLRTHPYKGLPDEARSRKCKHSYSNVSSNAKHKTRSNSTQGPTTKDPFELRNRLLLPSAEFSLCEIHAQENNNNNSDG